MTALTLRRVLTSTVYTNDLLCSSNSPLIAQYAPLLSQIRNHHSVPKVALGKSHHAWPVLVAHVRLEIGFMRKSHYSLNTSCALNPIWDKRPRNGP